jgi:hypothetical protein
MCSSRGQGVLPKSDGVAIFALRTDLLASVFVGSTSTARCGDALAEPPRQSPKIPSDGHFRIFRRALSLRNLQPLSGLKFFLTFTQGSAAGTKVRRNPGLSYVSPLGKGRGQDTFQIGNSANCSAWGLDVFERGAVKGVNGQRALLSAQ